MNPNFWCDRRVFVTGHTGFKGGWLSLWLQSLKAQVHGYSTLPPTTPNLFTVAQVREGLASHVVCDVRDAQALKNALVAAEPEIVFHLAAQPLVRHSYAEPVETYAVNVMGTVNLLEAVRACPQVKAVVNVTTDKCYENREWVWGYRENEPLGGRDPYSSSKACSELVTSAYRDSFLATSGVGLATARAGNVIGGGDWATDRLVPDFFRAKDAGISLAVRHPEATRPWQHVLEPLCGYLTLAEHLASGSQTAEAWNFGPADDGVRPVRWILDYLTAAIPGANWHSMHEPQVHEAKLLKLDSSKAMSRLGWQPRWKLETALSQTAEWHEAWRKGSNMQTKCLEQIAIYHSAHP
jgi:CDP-glucose 4,6-dehydratase